MTVTSLDNDIIMLKRLSTCRKIQKTYMRNACITCNNYRFTVKFHTKVAHDKPIPYAKQNSEISIGVIDNDVIVFKFEHFRQKALNFKRLYLSRLWMRLCEIW